MAAFAFGIGILIPIFGPLLLLPLTWLVDRLLVRRWVTARLAVGVRPGAARWLSRGCSALVVAAVLAISHAPGRFEFDRLCATHATPTLSARVQADGFFRTQLYPSDAARWLERFDYVESDHGPGVYVRYTKLGDDLREEEVTTLRSRYGVREDLRRPDHGIVMTEKTVYELATEQTLARAASIVYPGGPLVLLLGFYAVSACPDPSSEPAARDFQTFHDLETIVLRAADPPATTAAASGFSRWPRQTGALADPPRPPDRQVIPDPFAAALDTESHAVAEVAEGLGVPFVAIRAVADPAEDVRPALADREAKTPGEAHSLALLGHFARAPWELPAAWRFSQHGKLALAALRRVAALGPEPLAFRPT